MRESRRHIAVMFTDIVGYTALMGSDEDRAFEVLDKNRKIHSKLIKQFNGTLIKEMGDGMLISFDLASEAVRCAIEIQKACKVEGIPLKIGIHEGEMVFEGNDVLGDGVNIASRLESETPSGCISISGSVYHDIRNKADIQTQFVAEKQFKNVHEKIKVYRVLCGDEVDHEAILSSQLTMPQKKSIIVLPFENISSDPEQEYFSDGLTEEIITDLSYIHDLLVISRSSAMTYKGSKKKIREIALEAQVHYVLEGSVRKAGNKLKIIAQLINAKSDTHLWAEKYSGQLDNVFEIQESVSRSIANSLKIKLTEQEDKKISQKQISDIQAYEYYLKAKKEIYTWTEPAMERALDYLQKGLTIVGENILLYYGIGLVYWTYINIGFKDKNECIIKAEQYAKKIFDLDADSVYGHRLLGIINFRRSKLQQAVFNLKQALDQDPNDPDALMWLTVTYTNVGRPNNAKPWIERAIKIDPFNPWHPAMYAWACIVKGDFGQALDISMENYNLVRDHPSLSIIHAIYLTYNNQYKEASVIFEYWYKRDPEGLWPRMGISLKYALNGEKENAIKAMSGGVKEKARCDLYDALLMAECDALIGEHEEAITSLECAINLGAINYPFYNEIDPFLENIRGEPRFKKLMQRVKLEWDNFEV